MIVAIHGYKGTPQALEDLSQLTELVGGVASIVYPAGTPLDLGYGWNSGAGRFATKDEDDVAYLATVVDHMKTQLCRPTSTVVLAGESNGGGMAVRVACDHRFANSVDSVVLVNPAIDAQVLALCEDAPSPVRLITTAGLLDEVVGTVGERDPFVAVDLWYSVLAGALAGCTGAESRTELSPTVEVRTTEGCARCAALYTVADGPHTWPGRPLRDDGYVPGSFEFTELVRVLIESRLDDCTT